jgi:hypothetical protein
MAGSVKVWLWVAVASCSMSLVALAQSTVDCAASYKSHLEKLRREEQSRMMGEQLAAWNRRAQRIYDACQTGHFADPKALFDRLDRSKD